MWGGACVGTVGGSVRGGERVDSGYCVRLWAASDTCDTTTAARRVVVYGIGDLASVVLYCSVRCQSVCVRTVRLYDLSTKENISIEERNPMIAAPQRYIIAYHVSLV